jgi:sulfite reductase (NADPH) flavoprotein alpha-component
MSLVPRLQDTAPFSPAQRAWLDGFITGLLSDAGDPPAADPADEELPWHDPTLALDERLDLAAGRRPEHRLMAAMAQLDCGQCGYLCESYAAAIASGSEASLSRCAPGGKATSRTLKELLAEIGSPGDAKASAAVPAAASVASPAPKVGGAPQFEARLREAPSLHRAGAERDTRHVVLETVDRNVTYQAGDSLGVVARNCPDLVGAIIERLAARADTPVQSPDGVECRLVEALSERCEIRRPSDQAIEVLASRATNRDESRVLQAMAEGYPGAGPQDADLLDLLDGFPSARPPVPELIAALDSLQPRLYSIASSPKKTTGEIHLAVAVVRYRLRDRERSGVASTFLSDRLSADEAVSVYVNPADGFRLPASDRPVIMIGPGTGIAPFRAFLEERQITGARGRNWLFFGNPRRASDFLFEDELTAYCRDGLLTRLDTAFSRDQPHKIYVQHRMLEHAAELWAWLENGAYLYVCGDAERMARDVDRGLAYIVTKEGGMDMAGAKAYLARLTRDGRYVRDVY